jgi:hypothetical protein
MAKPFFLTMMGKVLAALRSGKPAASAPPRCEMVNPGGVNATINETSPMRARSERDRICPCRLSDLDRRPSRVPESREQDRYDVQQRVEPHELNGTLEAIDRSGRNWDKNQQ